MLGQLLTALAALLRSRSDLILENLALWQQRAVLRRGVSRDGGCLPAATLLADAARFLNQVTDGPRGRATSQRRSSWLLRSAETKSPTPCSGPRGGT